MCVKHACERTERPEARGRTALGFGTWRVARFSSLIHPFAFLFVFFGRSRGPGQTPVGSGVCDVLLHPGSHTGGRSWRWALRGGDRPALRSRKIALATATRSCLRWTGVHRKGRRAGRGWQESGRGGGGRGLGVDGNNWVTTWGLSGLSLTPGAGQGGTQWTSMLPAWVTGDLSSGSAAQTSLMTGAGLSFLIHTRGPVLCPGRVCVGGVRVFQADWHLPALRHAQPLRGAEAGSLLHHGGRGAFRGLVVLTGDGSLDRAKLFLCPAQRLPPRGWQCVFIGWKPRCPYVCDVPETTSRLCSTAPGPVGDTGRGGQALVLGWQGA